MIQSTVKTKATPQAVWEMWRKIHNMDETFAVGKKGSLKGRGRAHMKYRILEVSEGKHFSILWKSLFVRLVFTHAVFASLKGAEIRYTVQVKGPLAWPMRFLLGSKIGRNLDLVLQSLSKELDRGVSERV